jgi:hypothetical protein
VRGGAFAVQVAEPDTREQEGSQSWRQEAGTRRGDGSDARECLGRSIRQARCGRDGPGLVPRVPLRHRRGQQQPGDRVVRPRPREPVDQVRGVPGQRDLCRAYDVGQLRRQRQEPQRPWRREPLVQRPVHRVDLPVVHAQGHMPGTMRRVQDHECAPGVSPLGKLPDRQQQRRGRGHQAQLDHSHPALDLCVQLCHQLVGRLQRPWDRDEPEASSGLSTSQLPAALYRRVLRSQYGHRVARLERQGPHQGTGAGRRVGRHGGRIPRQPERRGELPRHGLQSIEQPRPQMADGVRLQVAAQPCRLFEDTPGAQPEGRVVQHDQPWPQWELCGKRVHGALIVRVLGMTSWRWATGPESRARRCLLGGC